MFVRIAAWAVSKCFFCVFCESLLPNGFRSMLEFSFRRVKRFEPNPNKSLTIFAKLTANAKAHLQLKLQLKPKLREKLC